MKRIKVWLLVFVIFISACKSQDVFLDNLNNSFINYIKNDDSDEDDLEEYLDDNIKHITHSRESFLKQVDKKTINKANLIENLNKSSNRIYSAVLQIEDSIYTYEYYISKDSSKFKKTDIKTFRDNKIRYESESCILSKMMNNDLEELLDDKITSNFHYIVYTTSINDKKIKVHSLKDICR